MQLLRRMQTLLAQLYDAPVLEDVEDFVLSDRQRLRQVVGEHRLGCPVVVTRIVQRAVGVVAELIEAQRRFDDAAPMAPQAGVG
jgi:hypothetical protein